MGYMQIFRDTDLFKLATSTIGSKINGNYCHQCLSSKGQKSAIRINREFDAPMTTVQSLDRAIELLRLISAEHKSGARLSTLVAASGLAQPTVHRLLKQLVEGGLVMQDAQRRYRLGHFAYELGLVASTHFHL
ncbi:MAG: hypothetical protein EOO29_36700, partial [Comamonadaceae bacterium]